MGLSFVIKTSRYITELVGDKGSCSFLLLFCHTRFEFCGISHLELFQGSIPCKVVPLLLLSCICNLLCGFHSYFHVLLSSCLDAIFVVECDGMTCEKIYMVIPYQIHHKSISNLDIFFEFLFFEDFLEPWNQRCSIDIISWEIYSPYIGEAMVKIHQIRVG